MTFKLNLIFFLITTVLLSFIAPSTESSLDHPMKLTSSEIKYDINTKSIKMECKVFIDDFAPVINPTLFVRAQKLNLTNDDKKGIERYFQEKYRIFINHRKLSLSFEEYSIRENVMSIRFSENYVSLQKDDEIYVENELLFEEFDYQQSNWITFNMPPFIFNRNFESKKGNFTYSFKF